MGARAWRLLCVLWLVHIAVLGCGSKLTRFEAGTRPGLGAHYLHEERQYRILDPAAGNQSRWQPAQVPGADLAFRSRDGSSSMSLVAECSRKAADPMILARHLVIGVPERNLRQAGPALVDGVRAWSQTFDTDLEGVAVRVKTVTAATPRCSYDWILVASGSFDALEREFDTWWRSFQYGEDAASGDDPERGEASE